jgi:hypothetical protein
VSSSPASRNFDGLAKVLKAVTPAKAGVQKFLVFLDSGFRRNDRKGRYLTFYEAGCCVGFLNT